MPLMTHSNPVLSGWRSTSWWGSRIVQGVCEGKEDSLKCMERNRSARRKCGRGDEVPKYYLKLERRRERRDRKRRNWQLLWMALDLLRNPSLSAVSIARRKRNEQEAVAKPKTILVLVLRKLIETKLRQGSRCMEQSRTALHQAVSEEIVGNFRKAL